MSERKPPAVTPDTPIGPDVDLDEDDVRLADGTRLTNETAEAIVDDVRRAAGRPSLTGTGSRSPRVSARITPELQDELKRYARRRGVSLSEIFREALSQFVKNRPGARR
jgi:hypothetical protein